MQGNDLQHSQEEKEECGGGGNQQPPSSHMENHIANAIVVTTVKTEYDQYGAVVVDTNTNKTSDSKMTTLPEEKNATNQVIAIGGGDGDVGTKRTPDESISDVRVKQEQQQRPQQQQQHSSTVDQFLVDQTVSPPQPISSTMTAKGGHCIKFESNLEPDQDTVCDDDVMIIDNGGNGGKNESNVQKEKQVVDLTTDFTSPEEVESSRNIMLCSGSRPDDKRDDQTIIATALLITDNNRANDNNSNNIGSGGATVAEPSLSISTGTGNHRKEQSATVGTNIHDSDPSQQHQEEENAKEANNPPSSSSSVEAVETAAIAGRHISVELEIANIIQKNKRILASSLSSKYQQYYQRPLLIQGKLKKVLERIDGVKLEIGKDKGGSLYAVWEQHHDGSAAVNYDAKTSKNETVTTDEANALRGGTGNDGSSSRRSQQSSGDTKKKKIEKLIELTPAQAEETKFPHGCRIIYNYEHDTSSSSTRIRMGVVHSVNVSLRGDFIYEIKGTTANNASNKAKEKEERGGRIMIDENMLAYAPTTPIYFQRDAAAQGARKEEGTVLLSSRGDDDDDDVGEFRYSVLLLTLSENNGEQVIQHDVTPEQLSFRPTSSLSTGGKKANDVSVADNVNQIVGKDDPNLIHPEHKDERKKNCSASGKVTSSKAGKAKREEESILADTSNAKRVTMLQDANNAKVGLCRIRSVHTSSKTSIGKKRRRDDAPPQSHRDNRTAKAARSDNTEPANRQAKQMSRLSSVKSQGHHELHDAAAGLKNRRRGNRDGREKRPPANLQNEGARNARNPRHSAKQLIAKKESNKPPSAALGKHKPGNAAKEAKPPQKSQRTNQRHIKFGSNNDSAPKEVAIKPQSVSGKHQPGKVASETKPQPQGQQKQRHIRF